ncbi:MAG TPA: radical SAM protein [Thermodesulfovibrionales bacterium]|nr:radical SAM protein [Thermodesulfovibrionales bacterium]
MRVLLINPAWDGVVSRKGSRFNRRWPPLCLLNCASLLEREGISCEIIDLRAEKSDPSEISEKASVADRVFVTSSPIDRWQCPNIELKDFYETLEFLPKDNLHIMGAHGTMFPEKILIDTCARSVIVGEPEMTVLDLCRTDDISGVCGIAYIRDGQVVRNPERELMDLNELPVPAYTLVDLNRYEYELLGDRFALLETSRGCSFSCVYCYQGMYGWKRIRRKSVEKVTAEIDYMVRTADARSLYFIDLEFTFDRNFVHRICDHIAREGHKISWCCQTRADMVDADLLNKMKKAGCRLVHYGVETGSEKVMKTIRKNITLSAIEDGISLTMKAGIETACFFMFGFPGETNDDMEATVKFALKLNPTYASFHIATPYSGTELYNMTGSDEAFPEAYTAGHSLDDLKGAVRKALRRFYIRPAYILSHVFRGTPALWKKQLKLFMEFKR